MSREEQQSREGLRTSEQADGGPGAAYVTFVVMEELLDKLKLVRYDQEFVKALKMKPLNR
jgi:estrogen-related receptor beta like 1